MNKTQKKILYITSRSDVGGGPLALKWLIESVIKGHGASVKIFVAAPKDQYFSAFYQQSSQDFFSLPFRCFSLVSLLGLYSFIKKNNINNVHSMGRGASFYAFGCALLLRSSNIKWHHTFHGLHYGTGLKELLKKIADKIIFRFCVSSVFALSPDEKKIALEVLHVPENKIFSIHNFVSPRIDQFKRQIELEKIKKRWPVPEGKTVVGLMGRNDSVKGQKLLEEKIIEIEKNFPGKFHFLRAKDIPPEENGAWPFLAAIDIYLSHSLREGSPLVVLESLELGKFCLLSDIPGHRQLLSYHPLAHLLDFFTLNASGLEIGQKLLSLSERPKNELLSFPKKVAELELNELLLQYV